MNRADLLAAARGDRPSDLLLTNCRLLNVFSGEIEECDIAIFAGKIAGIGQGYRARQRLDLRGAYVAPGLIDAHVHIESSLCIPPNFAAGVLPHGVTCSVIDPHEIANVAGVDGIRFMADSSRELPLHVVVMAPSCVPATQMETNGTTLNAADLTPLLADGTVCGLAEVMNFPGVVAGDPAVLEKLRAFDGHPVDGHAPALVGSELNAYVAAGIGSEHECTTVEEAAEKLARGMVILIREATNARNLRTLLPLVNAANSRRICFCTDDRIPGDIIDLGTIDYMIREAIAFGIDPVTAVRMATLNPAEWFGLHERGAIAPGRVADLIVIDDLDDFHVRQVFVGGEVVAEQGRMLPGVIPAAASIPTTVQSELNVEWHRLDFSVPATSTQQIRLIGAIESQLVTEYRTAIPSIQNGLVVVDPDRDILKMAVIDRHRASGAIGLGFIQGFGLKRGAIAGTVAHDHHNLVIIGASDAAMMSAARAIREMGGGLVVVDENGERLAALQLPVAGLMSDRPFAEVRRAYDALLAAACALGATFHDPFMAMSFMALEVIPELKLTDQGLVDVERFELVELFV